MVARLYTPVEGVDPEPAKYGLLNSKTVVSDGSRWGGGISIDPVTCSGDVRTLLICDESNEDIITSGSAESQYYLPFTIEAEHTCGTFGWKANNYEEKARKILELAESKAAEHEFWTGALAQQDTTVDSEGNPNPNRYLASLSAVTVAPSGTPLHPRHGLALLEKALGDCGVGVRGFIHATRDIVSSLSDNTLTVEGDTLVTTLGNIVIAGAGYDGSGPNGTVPSGSQSWMYATGQVAARLGTPTVFPDNLSEATNTSINEVSFMAARDAAVTWDGCCHYAVLVDLSLEYS
jgi:hypothetical protein